MGTLRIKNFAAAFAAFLASSLAAFASEKALLDSLVSKGVITREEATAMAKSMVENTVSVKRPDTKEIKIRGYMQFMYEWTSGGMESGPQTSAEDTSRFFARRIRLIFEAKVGGGWSAQTALEFNQSSPDLDLLIDAYIQKTFDSKYLPGTVQLGYRKSYFGHENVMSSSSLYCAERSMVSSYWTGSKNSRRLGFGGRYVGGYWLGDADHILKGLKYGLAVTNSYNTNPIGSSLASRENGGDVPNVWADVSWSGNFGEVHAETGIAFGYGDEANRIASENIDGSIWGINPKLKIRWRSLTLFSEFFMSGVEYGAKRLNGTYAYSTPMGVSAVAEYLFDIGEWGKIGPVVRYGWLDTDNRGVVASDASRNANSAKGDTAYNAAQTVYGGVNWYLKGNDLKIQVGYEWSQLNGTPFESRSHLFNGHSVRVQFQVVF